MVKIVKGITSAILDFIMVGVVVPEALEYFAPSFSSYISLPPSTSVFEAFGLLGAALAVTGFLQNAYSKGDFPWLAGKIGGGVVDLLLFYYLFLLLPSGVASSAAVSESSGLVVLLALALVFSYGYLILDFIDARRTKRQGAQPVPGHNIPAGA